MRGFQRRGPNSGNLPQDKKDVDEEHAHLSSSNQPSHSATRNGNSGGNKTNNAHWSVSGLVMAAIVAGAGYIGMSISMTIFPPVKYRPSHISRGMMAKNNNNNNDDVKKTVKVIGVKKSSDLVVSDPVPSNSTSKKSKKKKSSPSSKSLFQNINVNSTKSDSSSSASPTKDEDMENETEKESVIDDELGAVIASLRDEYFNRYGGKYAATEMHKRGVKAFHKRSNPKRTIAYAADRLLRAAASPDKRFVMSFAGYSVTLGRGNAFNQSFPFVVERILKDPMEKLGIDLVVRNHAVGGVPSFPFGWCLNDLLGEDSDVVSWDYAMNEENDPKGFEAYVRNVLTMPKQPMLIMIDSQQSRMELLKQYVSFLEEMDPTSNTVTTVDPIALFRARECVDPRYLRMPEEERPEGFKNWDEWGSPRGTPGRIAWHPKYMEHELLGWNVAIHFLKAIVKAGQIMHADPNWKDQYAPDPNAKPFYPEDVGLPNPINSFLAAKSEAIPSMLHGVVPLKEDGDEDDGSDWHMNRISCRTSFLPQLSGNMSNIVVSGVVAPTDNNNILEEKDDSLYESGWVLDIGQSERTQSLDILKHGGLGHIDRKMALYGIPQSGPLRLWLPYEGKPHKDEESNDKADQWFKTLLICEVNEYRDRGECKMEQDIVYMVGGANATSVNKVKSVAAYLRKRICVNIDIPENAKITRREDVKTFGGKKVAADDQLSHGSDGDIGLVLDLQITNKEITRQKGACSVAHVIWEQVSPSSSSSSSSS